MAESRDELGLIVAMSQQGVIGSNGQLPWRRPEDLKHFKRTTLGHCLILGRKTWDSLPGALPGRTSIVVTRNADLSIEGAELASGVDSAIARARLLNDDAPMIAGGAEIYAQALPQVTRMWITRVHAEVDGDVHFPDWDADDWERIAA
ncbi:MAG: dihydrofolate reductase, partial [Myxococcota bacterium]|nr:dihydrofolate reductase [Myxococcota bacterium]